MSNKDDDPNGLVSYAQALEAENAKLRAALEEIANRLPEKWPDQQIARHALEK